MHLRKILRTANQRPAERYDLSRNLRTPTQLQATSLRTLLEAVQLPPSHPLSSARIPIFFSASIMTAPRSVARLVAYRRPFMPLGSTANFSSSASRAATPAGAPQPGFRLPPPKRWDQGSESSLDKASKYFLMAELFRGMYVVLEQYFRPP